MRKYIPIFTLLFTVFISVSSLCQELFTEDDTVAINATVRSIDWVGSKLVVRTHHYDYPDEITFTVPSTVKITKGTDTISLADIHLLDRVAIQCRRSGGDFIPLNIVVEE